MTDLGRRRKPPSMTWAQRMTESNKGRKLGEMSRRQMFGAFASAGVAATIRIEPAQATPATMMAAIRNVVGVDKDAPFSRPVQRAGSIHSHAILGGLHHHYVRV
jgi:hypothetical protein